MKLSRLPAVCRARRRLPAGSNPDQAGVLSILGRVPAGVILKSYFFLFFKERHKVRVGLRVWAEGHPAGHGSEPSLNLGRQKKK